MPFCPNCGAEHQGDIKFCPACGKSISAGQATQTVIGKKKNDTDKSLIGNQMENMRNFMGVFFIVGLFSVIYFLIFGNINPLTSAAVIVLGLFIVQARNFSSTQNNNTYNNLRTIFYIFVAIACLGLIYSIVIWGFYEFFILEVIYFLILFYLMYQYVMNAQMIIMP